MQTSTCVVCQERVNLLAQKLVTAQWVDGRSGALLSLTFHSDCFVRWYRETSPGSQGTSGRAQSGTAPAQEGQSPQGASGGGLGADTGQAALAKREPRGTQPPQLPAPPAPERMLTPDELQRLQQLRGRRDTDPPATMRPAAETGHSPADGPPANEGGAP